MKNLITGMIIGATLGCIVGTVASDDICDMKNMIMKRGKKLAKKYKLM